MRKLPNLFKRGDKDEYIYTTENTCAREINVEINGDVVTNVEFLGGGCNGNLKAIPKLVDGMTADQLTKAVREAYNAQVARG